MLRTGLAVLLAVAGCEDTPDSIASNPKAIAALLPVSLYFAADSDGKTPPDGSFMSLTFEPLGVVGLYQEDSSGGQGQGKTGKYAFDGRRLRLTFTAAGFTHDVTVSLDLTKPTVT